MAGRSQFFVKNGLSGDEPLALRTRAGGLKVRNITQIFAGK